MKKQRRHFKVDIPLTKDHYEGGYLRVKNAGVLSVSGVGYYDGSDYDYDIDEIHYILPKDHKDHNPNGKLLDLDMLETVCGWEPKEEDHIDLLTFASYHVGLRKHFHNSPRPFCVFLFHVSFG